MILVVEAAISVIILIARFHWALLYTNDRRIVRLVSRLLVPLAVYTAFDGALCVATGVIKVGPARYCSPRHSMRCNSRNDGLKCVR